VKGYDFLLVGQGLAGSSLAMHLLDAGKSVMIMDDRRESSSSKVAAGLYNPVTGRKMVKTWKADILFPYLTAYYQRFETLLGVKFLHERSIYRPFGNAEEQNEWMGKSTDSGFVKDVFLKKNMEGVHDPYGGILLQQCGYIDIPVYLKALAEYFVRKEILLHETFSENELTLEEGRVIYKGVRYKKIIFCDGTSATANTFFDWLPFRPVKGELLEVNLDARYPVILNRGVFVVEIGDGVYRIGSTYNNHDLSWEPTSEGKEYLLEKLKKLVDSEPVVQKHYAGVRPATADRHPIIGIHPTIETIGIFNGLGTKGVSLSPWFGKHFAGFLCGENELDSDVNISRYFSLY
jgi:glycine oxidase